MTSSTKLKSRFQDDMIADYEKISEKITQPEVAAILAGFITLAERMVVNPHELMTVKEVSQFTRLSQTSVRAEIEKGTLVSGKFGPSNGAVRVRYEHLMDYVNEGCRNPFKLARAECKQKRATHG